MSQGPLVAPLESGAALEPDPPEPPELPLPLELVPPLEPVPPVDPELIDALPELDAAMDPGLPPSAELTPEAVPEPEKVPDPEDDPLLFCEPAASGDEVVWLLSEPHAQTVAIAADTAKRVRAGMCIPSCGDREPTIRQGPLWFPDESRHALSGMVVRAAARAGRVQAVLLEEAI